MRNARVGVAGKPRIIFSPLPEQSPFRLALLFNLLRIFHAIQCCATACGRVLSNNLLGSHYPGSAAPWRLLGGLGWGKLSLTPTASPGGSEKGL